MMRRLLIGLVALVAAVLLTPAPSGAGVFDPVAEVLAHTNQARADAGREPLAVSPALAAAAQAYAETMATTGHFAHVGPDGSLPWDRARAASYPSGYVGENLAWSVGHPPAAVVAMWLASPAHRDNLLLPAYHALGVGHAIAPDGRAYWVLLLGDVVEESEGDLRCQP